MVSWSPVLRKYHAAPPPMITPHMMIDLRFAGLPYGSLTRRLPPKERTNTGTPTPVASTRRAGPDTVGTRPPTKAYGEVIQLRHL
jgi:hypothetical protein